MVIKDRPDRTVAFIRGKKMVAFIKKSRRVYKEEMRGGTMTTCFYDAPRGWHVDDAGGGGVGMGS